MNRISNFYTKNFSRSTTLLINPLSPSATIRNKKRAKMSPCLSPIAKLTSYFELPFTKTKMESEQAQILIQLLIIYSKKDNLTESYSLSKSTLKIIQFYDDLQVQSTISLMTVCLLGRKAYWDWEIMELSTLFSLEANNLEINL